MIALIFRGAKKGWLLLSLSATVRCLIGSKPKKLSSPEMESAAPEVQWTMNFCLAGIGIHFPLYRSRAIAIGEALGHSRDYPVSKGCTSPFAPIWIDAMVGRKG